MVHPQCPVTLHVQWTEWALDPSNVWEKKARTQSDRIGCGTVVHYADVMLSYPGVYPIWSEDITTWITFGLDPTQYGVNTRNACEESPSTWGC